MTLGQRIRAALAAIATFSRPAAMLSLGDEEVERRLDVFGGQLQPIPSTQTRWYLRDVESAEYNADQGHLAGVGRLMRAARKDGTVAGVLSTRTDGLVRLPKRFRGRDDIVAALELGHDETRSVFDEMCPPAELAKLAADGVLVGVGVARMVKVPNRDFRLMTRLDPEFLEYRWHENRWYFRSNAGELPITPGDGEWVLHMPGGRISPWQAGLWRCIGQAVIRKAHAKLHKDNWEAKLANAARVAIAPAGASEAQQKNWFQRVAAWGLNTVFSLRPGYDVKLLESNGNGYESFEKTVRDENDEIKIALAGQLVTSDGGAGFQNSDIHKSIRADLIKATADGLAYTLNTQVIPSFVVERYGEDALNQSAFVEWDVEPPKDRQADATSLVQAAKAYTAWRDAAAAAGQEPDLAAFATRFGVPLKAVEQAAADAVEDENVPRLRLVEAA